MSGKTCCSVMAVLLVSLLGNTLKLVAAMEMSPFSSGAPVPSGFGGISGFGPSGGQGPSGYGALGGLGQNGFVPPGGIAASGFGPPASSIGPLISSGPTAQGYSPYITNSNNYPVNPYTSYQPYNPNTNNPYIPYQPYNPNGIPNSPYQQFIPNNNNPYQPFNPYKYTPYRPYNPYSPLTPSIPINNNSPCSLLQAFSALQPKQ